MSGSQVKRVFNDTKNLFLEKTGQQEVKDLGAIKKVAHYLDAGNFMEPIIINMARELRPDLGDIKVTKETFEKIDDSYYTANIDGYIGEDVDNIDYIVEIKNTTEESNEGILAKYEPQVRYYSNIMGASKGAYLIALVNGHDLRVFTLLRDEEKETEMFQAIEDFRSQVELGIEPDVVDMEKLVKDERKGDTIAEADLLKQLADAKEALKEAKAEEERLVKEVKSLHEESFKITTGGFTFAKSTTNRKGSIDNNKLLEFLIGESDYDYTEITERFRKDPTSYETVRVTKVKE